MSMMYGTLKMQLNMVVTKTMAVFWVFTHVRWSILMFRRNVLPPSSGWLDFV